MKIRNSKGFTLVEIMIVVAIIGILIAIAIPGFVRARETSRARACQENLTKIDGAKEQWALENNAAQGDAAPALADLVGDNNYIKRTPECPSGGAYTVGNIGTDPTCDIGGSHALVEISNPITI
ncbi:MAG: prepilin-type N-terminal cleavage/methylation domain-containing protein [bacterium]